MKFHTGDIVEFTEGKYAGEYGRVFRVPDEKYDFKSYLISTESFPSGVIGFELNMKRVPDGDIEFVKENNPNIMYDYPWHEFIPANVDPVVFFAEMAEIYPKYNKDYNIKKNQFHLSICEGGEGPVPHCHIYYGSKKAKGDGTVAYIQLGKNEYAPQHKKTTKILNPDECEALITFFKTKLDSKEEFFGVVKEITCWENAVKIWINQTEFEWEQYFTFDKKGFPIMPNYSEILMPKKEEKK